MWLPKSWIHLCCIAVVVGIPIKTDYCTVPFCWEEHVACKNNGSFGPECPEDVQVVDLTPHKEYILTLYNEMRNKVAGGMESFPPAARMAEMRWDNELASLAFLNANTCTMVHDSCRHTFRFLYSGQNIGLYGDIDERMIGIDDRWLLKNRMEHWFDEWQNTTAAMLASYPDMDLKDPISHFTIMVNERNTYTGCAAVRFRRNELNMFLVTCNYATNNIYSDPTYTAGEAASGCKTGKSPTFPNLCQAGEVYEVRAKEETT